MNTVDGAPIAEQTVRIGSTSWLRIARCAAAIAPATVGLVVLCALPHLSRTVSPATLTATWGLVLLASFVGWGAAANALAVPQRRFDLGMRAALGIAVHLALGGLLAAFSLVSQRAIIACVAGGLLSLAVVEIRQSGAVVRDWIRAFRIAIDSPLFVLRGPRLICGHARPIRLLRNPEPGHRV